jgi:hypothetical protein
MEAAVREPSEVVRASLELSKGDDNPNRVARNVLHDLRSAGFDIWHSASSLLPNEISAEDRRALMIGRAACWLLKVRPRCQIRYPKREIDWAFSSSASLPSTPPAVQKWFGTGMP